MASSISSKSKGIQDPPTITSISDSLYELYRPAPGPIDIEIVFFPDLEAQFIDGEYAWRKLWTRFGELIDEFPRARLLSVSTEFYPERHDIWLEGENICHDISMAEIGRNCPVVLVGYYTGGLLLKQVCLHMAYMYYRSLESAACGTFLGNVKGAVFYSTTSAGFHVQPTSKGRRDLHSMRLAHDAKCDSEFARLRRRYGWKTFGVSAADETHQSMSTPGHPQPTSQSTDFEEASARYDMDEFYVTPGENIDTILKPRDPSSFSLTTLVQFVKKIQDEEELRAKRFQPSDKFVDILGRVNRVIRELRLEEAEAFCITLVGMVGIGKTTLATAVVRQIRAKFELCCFVAGGVWKSQDFLQLISRNLYSSDGLKYFPPWAADEELTYLREKKVLILLDAFESEGQHDYLQELGSKFGAGSRLIVTCEAIHGWPYGGASFRVPFLSQEEAEKMLLAHLDDEVIVKIPRDMIKKMISKCGGLPLTVEVVGTYLHKAREITNWNDALKKLAEGESLDGVGEDRLWSKLRVRFDQLLQWEQDMFLDLVVFDEDLTHLRSVWENEFSSEEVNTGLRKLVDRAFVIVPEHPESSGQYWIQEQLRDLGRSSCRPCNQKPKSSRVWHEDDISYLLSKDIGDESGVRMVLAKVNRRRLPVEEDKSHGQSSLAIMDWPRKSLATTSPGSCTWRRATMDKSVPDAAFPVYLWRSVAQLRNLRFLRLSNCIIDGNDTHRFPLKLAYLHVSYVRPCLPDGVPEIRGSWPIREDDVEGLQKLTVLHLERCSSIRLPSNFHRLRNLKYLIISGRDLQKPLLLENFEYPPWLRTLILEGVGFSVVPDSLSRLVLLETLRLTSCSGIKTLSDDTWGFALPHLTELSLVDLPDLTELPESVVQSRSLERLEVSKLPQISRLPKTLGRLRNLKKLHIRSCDALQSVPDNIGESLQLDEFIIFSEKVAGLPESVWQLRNLRILSVACPNLEFLPRTLGQLRALENLTIRCCDSLERLPETLGDLNRLVELSIELCDSLLALPDSLGQLKSLVTLKLKSCTSLNRMPESLGQLESLKELELKSCLDLKALPDTLGQLKSLVSLKLVDCTSLKSLPETFGELTSLETLKIKGCDRLKVLPETIRRLKGSKLGKILITY